MEDRKKNTRERNKERRGLTCKVPNRKKCDKRMKEKSEEREIKEIETMKERKKEESLHARQEIERNETRG